jgi:hypothetical protein
MNTLFSKLLSLLFSVSFTGLDKHTRLPPNLWTMKLQYFIVHAHSHCTKCPHCKTLWIRNVQEMDSLYNKSVSLLARVTFTGLDKHTSLLCNI